MLTRMAMKFDGVSDSLVEYTLGVDYEHEHRDAEHEHEEVLFTFSGQRVIQPRVSFGAWSVKEA